jgi:uncharacterized RDD family membrane protein YckC
VERSLDVRTGESIAVHYELAGLGSRFLAVAIDMSLQLAVTAAIAFALGLLAPAAAVAVPVIAFGKPLAAVLIALVALAFFTLYFGYFIIFELAWHGRTPGKRALGLRVVRDAGFPVDVGAAVIRNVVRIVELGLGAYVVSAVVMLVSPQNKRIGDYAAGTIVVREARGELAAVDAALAGVWDRDDGLGAEDRVLIERFLVRRDDLEPGARRTIAARIAGRVRPKLRAAFNHLDDEALLEHLGRPMDRTREMR